MKQADQSLGFWERFYQIFTPKFISKLLKKPTMAGKSWGFWFLSNTILVVIFIITGAVAMNHFAPQLPQIIEKELAQESVMLAPETKAVSALELIKNTELKVENGILSVENIPDPLIFGQAFNEDEIRVFNLNDTESIQDSSALFVLDTQNISGINEALIRRKSQGGILINQESLTIWDGQKNKLQSINFSDFSNNSWPAEAQPTRFQLFQQSQFNGNPMQREKEYGK